MFLENIENFPLKSKELSSINLKHCTKCSGLGSIPNPDGTYKRCNCQTRAMLVAREICNGIPEKNIKLTLESIDSLDSNTKDYLNKYTDDINGNFDSLNNLFFYSQNILSILDVESALVNKIIFKRNKTNKFFNCLVISFEDLLDTFKQTKFNSDTKRKFNKAIKNSDLLIINYVGNEVDAKGENASKLLNNIIIDRNFNSKLTFISSSYTVGDMSKKYTNDFINIIKNNYKVINLSNNTNVNITESNDKPEGGDNNNGFYY